ncbi:MAG TPA: hypothetical protein IAA54_09120 [Candidatus Gallacutalibacter pullicola]|uniref:Uncharacterized protein n=1 Tax=Candidatus Gallacutalibacter pullicola TaxID=2840830 RepID=A0A9D1J225_9FIRM|nr:hypothetical protein [Candidatus Gallacutalibacter pullicola]
MQDMVKQIVDMDRKAREITDAAQLDKINSEKEVQEKRVEIREQYLAKARARIALNEPQERAAAEAAWKKVQQHNEEVSRRLDELACDKKEEWIRTIAARVIGE